MPPTVISALVAQYPAVINQMEPTFNAHDFIQKLSQQNQALYIEALYHYKGSREPFTTVHQLLGQQLNDFPNLIKRVGDEKSTTLFGSDSTVSKWEKF